MLSPDEIDRLQMKIAAAEALTTAELRVALVRSSWLGIKHKARKVFERYDMHKTAGRNAVLVVLDVKSHELLLYGDEGVNDRVDPEFWDRVRDAMIQELRAGRLAAGLSTGIQLLGQELARLFPSDGTRKDELSNALIVE